MYFMGIVVVLLLEWDSIIFAYVSIFNRRIFLQFFIPGMRLLYIRSVILKCCYNSYFYLERITFILHDIFFLEKVIEINSYEKVDYMIAILIMKSFVESI